MNPKGYNHTPEEYNFKEYENDTVEKAVKKYGNGDIVTAVCHMVAKIASLQEYKLIVLELMEFRDLDKEGEE